jgi:hypothetical protein
MKSKKIRNSARGEDCQVRIPGICNFNPETTILAHVGSDKFMGGKCSDLEATYCCSSCHSAIDGQSQSIVYPTFELKLWAKEGAERTREILFNKGLIEVAK